MAQLKYWNGTAWVAAVVGAQGQSSLYYGSFTDSTTQTNAGATSANLVAISGANDVNGVTIASGGKITFQYPGAYLFNFLGQFITTGGGSNYAVTVWYTKNGSQVVNSAATFTTSGVNGQMLANVEDIVVAAAGDYIQFYWWSQNTYMQLLAIPAGSSPTRPASPSVKLNVFNVG